MNVTPGNAVELTRLLVGQDSRNPSIDPEGPGEGAVARALAGVLREWGLPVTLEEAAPGRPNVIARVGRQRSGAPTLLFTGHLDVVGIAGMKHAPFAATENGGRLFGRGASDMKGGVAAMCAAAARAAAGLDGTLIVAAVVDEEFESIGTRALLASGLRADAAVITEPTRLAIMPAHRGFAWITVVVHGRAAHGSRYDLGVDAIRHAGLLLSELDLYEERELVRRTHPLLGRASWHASPIEGGIGLSTYPDRCVLRLERRTLPGENAAGAVSEVRDACERVRSRRPDFVADVSLAFAQGPSDVAPEAPIVRALGTAIAEQGGTPRIEGMSAWTDAALLNDGGIPAICFGPGDISLAHASEEWIEVAEIERATMILTTLAKRWLNAEGAAWRA